MVTPTAVRVTADASEMGRTCTAPPLARDVEELEMTAARIDRRFLSVLVSVGVLFADVLVFLVAGE
jgi:hypothetical protein